MDTSLSPYQVALAAALIGVNGIASLALGLRLERTLAIASLRTVVQLLLIGLVLQSVFRLDRWYVVIVIAAIMTTIAGVTAVGRSERRYPGIWLNTLVSVWVSSWLVAGYFMLAIRQDFAKWYEPQFTVPLLGMILGNTLNGISVGLSTLLEAFATRVGEIETKLALGATSWEAAGDVVRRALRTGLTPILNSMMVVGIVSLPGMMTGQILAGADPIQAVKYQIVIMFLIASATALSTVTIVLLSFRKLFTTGHRFRVELLSRRKTWRRGRRTSTCLPLRSKHHDLSVCIKRPVSARTTAAAFSLIPSYPRILSGASAILAATS